MILLMILKQNINQKTQIYIQFIINFKKSIKIKNYMKNMLEIFIQIVVIFKMYTKI